MIDATTFLSVILCILGSILMVTLIILVVKLINVVGRFNTMLDEVDKRVQKFDRIFRVADVITDNMALVSDKLVDGLSNVIRGIFNRKRRKEDEINE